MKTDGHIGCCGCGCPVPEKPLVKGRPTWFGSYRGAELTEFVCTKCYDQGVRTELQRKAKENLGRACISTV